jgi:hypothetical protein
MDRPRPRPASGVRFEVAQRVLVDVDERDVASCGGRIGGARQPPVVGFELDALKKILTVASERSQQKVREEDNRGRTKANQESRDGFTHADQYRWGSTN